MSEKMNPEPQEGAEIKASEEKTPTEKEVNEIMARAIRKGAEFSRMHNHEASRTRDDLIHFDHMGGLGIDQTFVDSSYLQKLRAQEAEFLAEKENKAAEAAKAARDAASSVVEQNPTVMPTAAPAPATVAPASSTLASAPTS